MPQARVVDQIFKYIYTYLLTTNKQQQQQKKGYKLNRTKNFWRGKQ